MDEQKPNAKEAWDRMSGVAPDQDVPNYLKEMLISNVSLQTGLSAVAIGAVLSLVFGAGFLLIPPLLAGGGAAIAALFVPSSPVFRAKVDRKKRAERRERIRTHLREKIENMTPFHTSAESHYRTSFNGRVSRADYDTYMQTYERMVQRLEALKKLADDSGAALTEHDIEKLDETTVDFLRLVHARMLVQERLGTDTGAIEDQLRSLDGSIEDAETAVDRRRLEQARDGLGRILKTRARLPARDAALKAQLLTMGEAYEDLYHRINADPSAGVSEYLVEATSRLSIEEELSLAVDDEMDELHKARQAKRARERA